MASDAVPAQGGTEEPEHAGWRPSLFGMLLIGAADFCAAVGVGTLVLGAGPAKWFVAAAVLLLAGISTGA